MSRWFRHHHGLSRDEKLLRVAERSLQPIDRVVWVWIAVLESAAELDRDGVFDVDAGELAYFLNVEQDHIEAILSAIGDDGLTKHGTIAAWDIYSRWMYRLPWTEWAVVRLYIFQRDNFTCRYCGASGVALECDHVIPVSKGGSNEKSNLVTSCRTCNRTKADKTPEEMGWAL